MLGRFGIYDDIANYYKKTPISVDNEEMRPFVLANFRQKIVQFINLVLKVDHFTSSLRVIIKQYRKH